MSDRCVQWTVTLESRVGHSLRAGCWVFCLSHLRSSSNEKCLCLDWRKGSWRTTLGIGSSFPFPLSLFCSVAELNFGFLFPCHFSPMVARVPGRGLPRSLTPAQLWRKCPVQTCVRPETVLHFSSRVLRASPCASALKSAARVQLQLCSVASQLLLPHLPAAHDHVHFLGY